MHYDGKIKELNHIVVSDPCYKKGTWGRYEMDDLKEKDWIVNLDVSHRKEMQEDLEVNYIALSMLIKKYDDVCDLTKDGISYLNDINLKEYKIGMDTACIALGINDKAKEIIESNGEWQPSCSIRTGTDGFFGNVSEGRDKNNNLCFIYIFGVIDDDLDYDIDYIKDYLVNQFEITDLTNEDVILGDNRVLNKGDIVEVSSCFILNDIKGLKEIRNSSYKNEIDGMHLTITNLDNSKKETILTANDKLVNNPIEVEVIDSFYDYETGYHYKGKIINKNLIQELNKFGNSESIFKVNFSEFDVLKVLEQNVKKGDLEL